MEIEIYLRHNPEGFEVGVADTEKEKLLEPFQMFSDIRCAVHRVIELSRKYLGDMDYGNGNA